ncbi:MAG: TonB-dependent receptor, partial [Planctomycetales bacterium]
ACAAFCLTSSLAFAQFRPEAARPQVTPAVFANHQDEANQPSGNAATDEETDSRPTFLPLEQTADRDNWLFPEVVTTVARQPSTVGRSPAAVTVVTQEMIRRSGARTIPDALRLVPGMHIAKVDANKWTVSARGFSNRFARNLLIQIDGRNTYNHLFAGTFWDVQDLLLNDIDRIEVIRGPGSTIWGANAINGVVNIITKSAKDTHGSYVEAGGGTEELGFGGARVGGVTEDDVHWRVSGKWYERDRQAHPNQLEFDDARQLRISGRTDWTPNSQDHFTVQGDYYKGTNGFPTTQRPFGFGDFDEPVSGGNVLTRWTRTFSDKSDFTFQAYYDRTDRNALGSDQNINAIDAEFQHRFPVGDRHNVIWGARSRNTWDQSPVTKLPSRLAFDPVEGRIELYSAFLQDEVELVKDKLYWTMGAKLEDNSFTDFEIQPTGRLWWAVDDRSAAWAAFSRGVRTPSRGEHEAVLVFGSAGPNIPLTVIGTPNVISEELLAYELGYRRQPSESFSWELATFYFVYEDLSSFRRSDVSPVLFLFANSARGENYGLELSAQWDVNEDWRLSGWYSLLRRHIYNTSLTEVPEIINERAYPINQANLMSSWDLGCDWEADVIARYVDSLPGASVPAYVSMDLRLAWKPLEDLELTVVGQNLLDTSHPEFTTHFFSGEIPTENQRSVYGMVTWEY